MNAEILCIGTELLLGNIVNTNSQYLAEQLSRMGIGVYRITEVGDNPERLKKALEESLARADLILTTGGLGPTRDDLSKEVAMDVFGQEPVVHEPTLARLRMQFHNDEERISHNRKQALFPKDAVVLQNTRGTAPGCILTSGDKRIVLLPGPPREMRAVFAEFQAWWEARFPRMTIRSKILRLAGIGESEAAHRLGDLLDRENPSLAPYAKPYEVTLRLTGRAETPEAVDTMIRELEQEVRPILGDYLYGEDSDTLEGTIVALLLRQKLRIAAAESLTGGLVTASLVNIPGVSEVLTAGLVTYTDEEKTRQLNVSRETLTACSAVSAEVCAEMLTGLTKATGADVGVATTGYAGPDGEDVGLVYIGVSVRGKQTITKHQFHGDREQIRNRATRYALTDLWRELRDV